jgi:phage replication-related protein YjqB (UPF0714/DUF867 family)
MFARLLAEPGVEERVELQSTFGFMAFHGGLEAGTEHIARIASERAGASLYTVVLPENLHWHIPSVMVDPAASPGLARFLGHVDCVVAVHGYWRRELGPVILLGGSNRELAAHVAQAFAQHLPGHAVLDDLDRIPAALRGLDRRNPVNRPRDGGVQLELPPRVRDPGADADALVAALAAAASTWSGTSAALRTAESR